MELPENYSIWLACDKDGELVLFKEKPFRDNWYGFWSKWKSGITSKEET